MEHTAQSVTAAVLEADPSAATRAWPARHPLPVAQRPRVQARVVQRVRDFLAQEGFEEISDGGPSAVAGLRDEAAAILGRELTGDPMLAHQICQLHLESLVAAGCRRICHTAEPRQTEQHAEECAAIRLGWIETGQRDMPLDELCGFQERLLKHISAGLHADLIGGPNATRIDRMLRGAHPRLSYREALAVLNRRGFALEFGDDLDREAQAALVHHCGNLPLQVVYQPAGRGFFNAKVDRSDPAQVECAHYILPFAGETLRGSVHEPDAAVLARRFRAGAFRAHLRHRAGELARQRSLGQPDPDREEIRGALLRMHDAAIERALGEYLAPLERWWIERAGCGLEVGRLLQYLLGLERLPAAAT